MPYLACLTFSLCLIPSLAHAYIGPGLGVVAIWSLFGPVAAIFSLVLILAYFPARYYYKKYKHAKKERDSKENSSNEDKKKSAK